MAYIASLNLFLVISFLLRTQCIANLDFFIATKEMERLLGIEGELWYMENGNVNRAAAEYELDILPHIKELYFSWRNKEKVPIPYSVQLTYEPIALSPTPLNSQLSIPFNGHIESLDSSDPVQSNSETFFIRLPHCEPSGSVEFRLFIKLTFDWPSSINQTILELRRRKRCPMISRQEPKSNKMEDSNDSKEFTKRKSPLSPISDFLGSATNLFYVSMGFLFGFVLILASMITLYFSKVDDSGTCCCLGRGNTEKHAHRVNDDVVVSLLGSPQHNHLVSSTPLDKRAVHTVQRGRTEGDSISSTSGGVNAKRGPGSASTLSVNKSSVGANTANAKSSLVNHNHQMSNVDQAKSTPRVFQFKDNPHFDIENIVKRLEIDRSVIEFGSVLLEGTFGEVRIGHLKMRKIEGQQEATDDDTMGVIIKKLKDEASDQQINRYLLESLRFANLLPHDNVCLPLAISNMDTDDNDDIIGQRSVLSTKYAICYAHDGFGNLKKFLLRCRGSDVPIGGIGLPPMVLSTQDLVYVALQIIRGLLHLHKHRLLHRDIATRNCLVSHDLRIQICDTGLSRDLFPQDYHCLGDNENRPIKWLSFESLERSEFSTASDVWAFGVTLWELTTLAQQPYADVDPFEMQAHLSADQRLSQPYNCPDELYLLMYCCWNLHPEARPTFGQLLAALEHFYAQLTQYI